MPLVTVTNAGLYCPGGGFHIDPRRGVPRAIVTHAHSDHARRGSDQVLVAEPGLPLAAARLGPKGLEGVPYGERRRIGDVEVSLHPAGHVLGSAQVRIECRGEVSVISGDYKLEADPTCAPFEPLRCHTFLTESTFALPVYRWPAPEDVIEQIQTWWAENRSEGRTSLIFAYSLGKAQRLLSLLHSGPRPIAVHPAMAPLNEAYQAAGVALPEVLVLGEETAAQVRGHAEIAAVFLHHDVSG
ncbi:MAG TPA: DNA ligase-associated DEXH box helicase, partial [Gemmatales bacterium]|nr:DNA ligase-associated DEXH box helicase [Gemmatales bacterium]